jgi:hypothetical protein
MTKYRWLSIAWITVSVLLAYVGGVATFAGKPGNVPEILRPLAIAALIVGLVGAAAFVLRWWRSYFRRMLDANFLLQPDGTYLVRRIEGRRREFVVYRLDKATKERILAWMANGLVAFTTVFVVMIFGGAAGGVIWPERLLPMLAILLIPLVGAVLMWRWINRRAASLVMTGIVVPREEWAMPPPPSGATTQNLRPLAIMAVLLALAGCLVLTVLLVDSEAGEITPDLYGPILGVFALLVVLPASIAIFAWWALRRQRRAAQKAPQN